MQRWPSGFTNAYVVAFTLDGALSLVDELLRVATGSSALLLPRNALALTVMWVSFLGIFWLPLTPRLPASLLLPLFTSVLWLNCGWAPLPLWLEPPGLGFAAAAFQLGLAGLAFAWLRRSPHAPAGWWDPGPEIPPFSPRHGLRVLALLGLVLLPVGLLYGVVLLATTVEIGTRGFVAFDRSGITLADRRYVRDEREIRLVGMMHIGESGAYRELATSFAVASTVVLEEGVTDRLGVMKNPLSYDGVARVLGLESQDDLAAYLANSEGEALPEWPVLRHADVDLAEFDPRTVEWLGRAQAVWSADGIAEALREALRVSSQEPEILAAVEQDIFRHRNEHLRAEIENALPEFEHVVVPWGALHLPAIETAILADGFRPTASQRRRLLSWGTVARALF